MSPEQRAHRRFTYRMRAQALAIALVGAIVLAVLSWIAVTDFHQRHPQESKP